MHRRSKCNLISFRTQTVKSPNLLVVKKGKKEAWSVAVLFTFVRSLAVNAVTASKLLRLAKYYL
jgi:hypothetical protein